MQRRWLVDTAVAAMLYALMVAEALLSHNDHTRLTAPGLICMVLVVLPTYARHRRPGWALAASVVALYVTFRSVDVHNTAPFSAMLCGYGLALVVDRRRTVLAGLLVLPAVAFLILDFNDGASLYSEGFKNFAYVAAPLLLGAAVRNRRLYLAALFDRAETAERTREEEAARRVAQERLRIAQDVHDVVSHAMVAINVQAGVGLHLLDKEPGRARQTLEDIRATSGEALSHLRSALGVLRSEEYADPPVAPALGLADLTDLASGLRSAGVDVTLDIDPAALTVPTGVGATGYRIVQEALTNVVRHAGSTTARVGVARREDRVVIEVHDDGCGGRSPDAPAGTGNGVRGMRERAAALGGTLEAGPDGPHGTGWRVRADLPVGAP